MSDLFDYPNTPGFKERTTSLEAASAVSCKACTMRELVLAVLQRQPALTADEIAERLGVSVLSVRPRVSELHTAGKIAPTGERRLNMSGMAARVWRLVEGAYA